MPPSPGRITSLPVKILYTVDTSPHSYVTILSDRQDVYVHPSNLAYGHEDEQVLLGSCCLKAVARGICFASPECSPHPSIDFSVYNLDPSLRSRQTSRAISTQSPHSSHAEDSSWTGKGFLSWSLNEDGNGSTLIRGRLSRDYDFATSSFNDQGGLQGLMAAAAARGVHREDHDGKGWGLEVSITLKQLNPEGKAEFAGRKEFEEMLVKGQPIRATAPATRQADQPPPPQHGQPQQHSQPPQNRPSPAHIPPPPVPRVNGSAASALPSPHSSAGTPLQRQGSSTTLSSAAAIRPPPPQNRPPPPQHRSSGASSLPSSSFPASSSQPPSRPSSTAPMSVPGPSSRLPPQSTSPYAQSSGSGAPQPRSESSHHRPSTPPPPPPRKSPPPSTPSRRTLHDLLRSEGKMSPDLAQKLASNPALLKLLKAVPQHALGNKTPPRTTGIFGTPSTGATVKAGSSTLPQIYHAEGCYNCKATESELWRTKNGKNGEKLKVCNACGLYFNKHKRMRPPELWGSAHTEDHPPDKRAKLDPDASSSNGHAVRSSPRLQRRTSDQASSSVTESPRRRARAKAIPHPSPRMATRAHSGKDAMKSEADSNSPFIFSPSSLFATSPANSHGVGAAGVTAGGGAGGDLANLANLLGGEGGEIDIDGLLAQLSDGAAGEGAFNLDALLAAGSGEGGTGETSLDGLLSGWSTGGAEGGKG